MPEKKSRESMCLLAAGNGPVINVPEFKITTLQIEELVSEIKGSLKLSSSKSRPCLSRKSSRASPYRVPALRYSENCNLCTRDNKCFDCENKQRRFGRPGYGSDQQDSDPYELLQKLLREGALVQEAVRRVQLGASTPKQRYFYESDDEILTPVLNCSQENESAWCN